MKTNMRICSNPTCKREYDPKKGGTLEDCAKCYQRRRRSIPLDKRDRASIGEGTKFNIRCSTAEEAKWKRAAKRDKMTWPDWVRSALDAKAGDA